MCQQKGTSLEPLNGGTIARHHDSCCLVCIGHTDDVMLVVNMTALPQI